MATNEPNTQRFYGHGKLLISGEYAVLDGALALALPTKLGQQLSIKPGNENHQWTSYSPNGEAWLELELDAELNPIENNSPEAKRLAEILKAVKESKPEFFHNHFYRFETRLEFEREWGLGSSSTLIHCLAQWVGIDPYNLLEHTFGGSGYDIACAAAEGPISYQLVNGTPYSKAVQFEPDFKENLLFVYQGRKQNSRDGILAYHQQEHDTDELVKAISSLTEEMLVAPSLSQFISLLQQHELMIHQTLGLPKVHSTHFDDFDGAIKSLGAWGGDFVLAASHWDIDKSEAYFKKKGYNTLFRYDDLIL